MPARASLGARFWKASHGTSASSSGERRRSRSRAITQPGNEISLSASSCSAVTSSRKRLSCSASQSRSVLSGSVSHASSW